MNLTSPSQVKAWCIENGFHPNKVLGQNFLIDRNALETIVDAGLAGVQVACALDMLAGQDVGRARVVIIRIDFHRHGSIAVDADEKRDEQKNQHSRYQQQAEQSDDKPFLPFRGYVFSCGVRDSHM